jgi:hypothetical protein
MLLPFIVGATFIERLKRNIKLKTSFVNMQKGPCIYSRIRSGPRFSLSRIPTNFRARPPHQRRRQHHLGQGSMRTPRRIRRSRREQLPCNLGVRRDARACRRKPPERISQYQNQTPPARQPQQSLPPPWQVEQWRRAEHHQLSHQPAIAEEEATPHPLFALAASAG